MKDDKAKKSKGKADFKAPQAKGPVKKNALSGNWWVIAAIAAIIGLLLLTVILPKCANAGEIDLSWVAPTTNVDGTVLDDLGGYTVYWYDTAGGFQNPMGNLDVGNVTTTTITVPSQGMVYMVVTAYDTSGNESGPSNEVSADFLASSVPTSLSVDGVRK